MSETIVIKMHGETVKKKVPYLIKYGALKGDANKFGCSQGSHLSLLSC